MGTGSFLGVKRPGADVDQQLTFSAEVKERVKLYIFVRQHIGNYLPIYKVKCPEEMFLPKHRSGKLTLHHFFPSFSTFLGQICIISSHFAKFSGSLPPSW
jgi:hypothetical protein